MTLGVAWRREGHAGNRVDRGDVLRDGESVGVLSCFQVGSLEREYVAQDDAGTELGRASKMYDALKLFA